MILTFLHKACVQWNEHLLSCTYGRVWPRALQTAFFKIQHCLSDSRWTRENGSYRMKDRFVVSPFLPGHYDENQWHLLHVIIVLHQSI